MKQSSIEWLFEQLTEVDYGCINKTFLTNNNILSGYRLRDLFNQAKEMHKQEVIDARVNGMVEGIGIGGNPINYNLHETHEQYYNETYNIKI